MNILLLLPILFPILTGAAIPVINFQNRKSRSLYIGLCTLLNSFFILFLLLNITTVGEFVLFHMTDSLYIGLELDGLGKIFAGLIALLWPIASFYAFEYMKHEGKENTFFTFYLMTYGVTCGIAFASNLVSLYFFYEFLTLVTLPLVMHGMSKKSIASGRKYVYYSLGGAAFGFIGLMVVNAFGGTSAFVFGGVLNGNYTDAQLVVIQVVYVLAVFGFGVKAAIFPFHGWLPSASVAPTPVTALLHAVAVVKAGAFAIIRITYYSFGTDILRGTAAQYIVMTAAMVTILFGSSMALKEQHFKRRLVYSTISNLSYIIFGASLMTPAGMTGAMLHLVFHGIIKITLFFGAGAVLYKTGREYVHQLYGLGKKMPVVFASFTVGGFALVGVPLLPGFISKWNLATGAASEGSGFAYAGIAVLLISTLLTAMYMLPLIIKAFFPGEGYNEEKDMEVKDPNIIMKLPLIVLSVIIIVLGVYSTPLIDFCTKIACGIL